MEILSIYGEEFKPYGRPVKGSIAKSLVPVLAELPAGDGVEYVPKEPALHAVADAEQICEMLFGGMPCQLGWCNGRNTKLNCLEWHRDSEFNLGATDFILLLAKQDDLEEGRLDTRKVKAFKVPADQLIEVYATTLHYAPCQTTKDGCFKVLVALPENTNTAFKPTVQPLDPIDRIIWARNKWLLAHRDSSEAAQGAFVGLMGENIDIAPMLK